MIHLFSIYHRINKCQVPDYEKNPDGSFAFLAVEDSRMRFSVSIFFPIALEVSF